MAVALYPYKFLNEYSEELQRKFVLVALLGVALLDAGEKLVRGDFFNPWYFPLFIFYLIFFISLPLAIDRPWVMRFSGWLLAVSLLAWSIVVRGILSA
jgi:hypothetical protein